MKKAGSKIIGMGMLFLCIIVVFLIITGKLNITGVNNKVDVQKENTELEYSKDIPEGYIEDYKDKFEWIMEPLADSYNPDEKVPDNDAYGYTVDEKLWQEQCCKEVNDYLKEADIDSDKCKQTDIYNISSIHNINEDIELKPYKCTIKVLNRTIHDNFEGFSKEYFVDDSYEKFNKCMSEAGNVFTYEYNDKEELEARLLENQKVKFVTFDIEIESESNWVQQIDAVPQLFRMERDMEKVTVIPSAYTFGDNVDFEIAYPIYIDIGLYNLDDYGDNCIWLVPMRKGESLRFECGYLVPENIVDECMLTFNTPYYTDYYYDPFRVLVECE